MGQSSHARSAIPSIITPGIGKRRCGSSSTGSVPVQCIAADWLDLYSPHRQVLHLAPFDHLTCHSLERFAAVDPLPPALRHDRVRSLKHLQAGANVTALPIWLCAPL